MDKNNARPMRVAVVIPRYHPVFGGAENQARLLNRRLIASGAVAIPFVVTMRASADAPSTETIDGIRVQRLGRGSVTRRGANFAFYAQAFRYLFQHRAEWDLIHCHATSLIGFTVTLLARILRRPVILKLSTNGEFVRGLSAERNQRHPIRRLTPRIQARLARFTAAYAHIVALNQEGSDELAEAGARHPILIPNGIDTGLFRPASAGTERAAARARLGFSPGDRIALFTGRFVTRKGIDVLLAAIDRLADNGLPANVRLCLAGSAEKQSEGIGADVVGEAVARLGAGRLTILPPVTPVVPYLQIADLFVFPSRQEGMPNSVLEALAVGLPCVLSDIRPHRELVTQNPTATIRLFASGNADSLADTLVHALAALDTRTPSPATALNPGFGIDCVADSYVRLYRRALSVFALNPADIPAEDEIEDHAIAA